MDIKWTAIKGIKRKKTMRADGVEAVVKKQFRIHLQCCPIIGHKHSGRHPHRDLPQACCNTKTMEMDILHSTFHHVATKCRLQASSGRINATTIWHGEFLLLVKDVETETSFRCHRTCLSFLMFFDMFYVTLK